MDRSRTYTDGKTSTFHSKGKGSSGKGNPKTFHRSSTSSNVKPKPRT